MKPIRAIPTEYRDVLFRSTLEADWAHTLDAYGISWSYEPEAIQLSNGSYYRPDFYLPKSDAWCEVKGLHGLRLAKAEQLAFDTDRLVVLLLPATFGRATWMGADPTDDVVLAECQPCGCNSFVVRGRSDCPVCHAKRCCHGINKGRDWARQNRQSGSIKFLPVGKDVW